MSLFCTLTNWIRRFSKFPKLLVDVWLFKWNYSVFCNQEKHFSEGIFLVPFTAIVLLSQQFDQNDSIFYFFKQQVVDVSIQLLYFFFWRYLANIPPKINLNHISIGRPILPWVMLRSVTALHFLLFFNCPALKFVCFNGQLFFCIAREAFELFNWL